MSEENMSVKPEDELVPEPGNVNSMTNGGDDMVITLGLSDSYRRYKYDFHVKDLCHGNLMKKAIGAFSIPSPVMCIFQGDKLISSLKNCSGKQYFEKFVQFGYDGKQRMYVIYVMHSSLLSTSSLSVFREQSISAKDDPDSSENILISRHISVKSLLQDKITEGWESFAQDSLDCLCDLLGNQPKIRLSESEFKAYSLRLLLTAIKKPGGYSGSKCEIQQCDGCQELADKFGKVSLNDHGRRHGHRHGRVHNPERDLRGATQTANPLVAHGANCDSCNERIFGCRHKCRSCADFDLCDYCFGRASSLHPGHAFKSIYGNGNGTFDLQHDAECDGCDSTITGVRYKCLDCPDFDYCEVCYAGSSKTHRGHRFVPIYERLKETATQKPIHLHVLCDGVNCRSQGRRCITGVRYKCAVCPNYDLCADCEPLSGSFHDLSHPFLKIKVPILSECPGITTIGNEQYGGFKAEHGKGRHMRGMGRHLFHQGHRYLGEEGTFSDDEPRGKGKHRFHHGCRHSREEAAFFNDEPHGKGKDHSHHGRRHSREEAAFFDDEPRGKGKHHFHHGRRHSREEAAFFDNEPHGKGKHHSHHGRRHSREEAAFFNGRRGHYHWARSSSSTRPHARNHEMTHSPTNAGSEKESWDSRPTSCNFWRIRKVPDEEFSHYWTMKNTGNVTWPVGTVMHLVSGKDMSLSSQAGSGEGSGLNDNVAPGEIVTFVMPMQAPKESGNYRSEWQMVSPDGQHFGARVHTTVEVLEDGSVTSLRSDTSMGSSTVLIPEIDLKSAEAEESAATANVKDETLSTHSTGTTFDERDYTFLSASEVNTDSELA